MEKIVTLSRTIVDRPSSIEAFEDLHKSACLECNELEVGPKIEIDLKLFTVFENHRNSLILSLHFEWTKVHYKVK